MQPEELRAAAGRLQAATGEIDRFWSERDRWLAAGRALGSDRIQRALATFCEYWSVALRSALDDSAVIEMRLRAAAHAYQTTDESMVVP